MAWSDASLEKQLVSNQGTVGSRFETSVSAKLPKFRNGEIQLLPDSVSNVEHHSVMHASWNFFQCFFCAFFFEETNVSLDTCAVGAVNQRRDNMDVCHDALS